jgi:hypothetical protein
MARRESLDSYAVVGIAGIVIVVRANDTTSDPANSKIVFVTQRAADNSGSNVCDDKISSTVVERAQRPITTNPDAEGTLADSSIVDAPIGGGRKVDCYRPACSASSQRSTMDGNVKIAARGVPSRPKDCARAGRVDFRLPALKVQSGIVVEQPCVVSLVCAIRDEHGVAQIGRGLQRGKISVRIVALRTKPPDVRRPTEISNPCAGR